MIIVETANIIVETILEINSWKPPVAESLPIFNALSKYDSLKQLNLLSIIDFSLKISFLLLLVVGLSNKRIEIKRVFVFQFKQFQPNIHRPQAQYYD